MKKVKIKGLFGFVLCLSSVCQAYAQTDLPYTVDLNFENAPLQELIDYLDSSSEYSFSYSSSTIPMNTLVSVQQEKVSLWQALDSSLEFMPVTYQVVDKKIILKYNDKTQVIRGTVTDSDSKQPVIGATVVVIGANPVMGAVTDTEGNFRLENVPIGRISLHIASLGYEERIIPNLLLGSGKEMVLDIKVIESIISMDEVVVEAATMGSQPINEMALVSGRSFTVEETKRFPISVGDPMRLASSFAGVMGTDDGSNEIIIRGNTPRGILWRMEGVEIPSPNHFSSEGSSSGGISMLSTQVLSRSDFYTGAFAPQYGNALSGVFDLHLRKGNDEKHERTIQAGFLGIDAALEGPLGNSGGSYLFNYRYSTLGILSDLGLLDIGESTNTFQDLSFKVSVPVGELGSLSWFGLGGQSVYKESLVDYFDNEEYTLGVTGLKYQLPLNKSTYIESSIAWTGTNFIDDYSQYREGNVNDETVRYASEEDITTFKKHSWRGSVLINNKINARNIVESGAIFSRIGFSFDEILNLQDSAHHATTSYKLFDDLGHTWTQQAYSSWKYRATDKLTFVSGLHLFHFNMNDEMTIEPRLSLKWAVSGNQSISFGFGKHSRMESLEYYLGNGLDENNVLGDHNRNLKVTKSNHFVSGYDRVLSPNLYFKTEVYYQNLYSIPIRQEEGSPFYSAINETDSYASSPLVNEGTGQNYGVELTLDKKFAHNYYFLINTSFFSSKYTGQDRVERDTRFAGNYTFHALGGKEWKVGRDGRNNIFGISAKVSGSGNQRYIGWMINPQAQGNNDYVIRDPDNVYVNNLPAYFRADLQVSYRKNKKKHTSEWRLDIQSVTNRENVVAKDYYVDQNGNLHSYFARQIGLIPILSYRIEF